MKEMDLVQTLRNEEVDVDGAVPLFRGEGREVYWIGSVEETQFRCNAYLLRAGDDAVLIDPGSRHHVGQVRDRVAQVLEPRRVTHIVVHHQDPDLCASIPDWLALNPAIRVLTHSRAAVLIHHYGFDAAKIDNIDGGTVTLRDGRELRFIAAPFMHFPGAFVTYDPVSRYVFSGDIFAALSGDWQLLVDDLESHLGFMELFHIDYMAGNKALRGFVRSIDGLEIAAFLPQHGSIIRGRDVPRALRWLEGLQCGLDIIYPHLSDF